MKCPIGSDEQLELLEAYCAGERNTPGTAALAKHLEGCAACRELVASQQAMWSALDEWKAPEASADFNRRLFARVEQEVSLWDRLTEPFRPLWVRLTVPVAAAASVALMLALILNHRPVQPQPGPVELSQPEQIEHALDDMQMLHDFNTAVRADDANAKM
ncbi:MAG TPA: zf-HC2 domain-containing protein [Bryobacteraceae bacterium]|nr:zf-HC2 domain-containing protein [Bryobacteraceae bacterium]